MIRLIALDMDGTLLNSKKELPKDFFSFVLSHPNIRVCIASGRQYYSLRKQFDEIKDHIVFVAENGTMVVDHDQVIYLNSMKKEDVISVLALLKKLEGVTIILCGNESAYMEAAENEAIVEATKYYDRLTSVNNLFEVAKEKNIIKFAIYFKNGDAEKQYAELRHVKEGLKTVLSGESWIDISNSDADKGIALEKVMELYHIEKEESMAFGDYLNDVEMLKAVTHSYAMKNAHPYIKEICRYQTDSNDEDGVMKILRTL